MLDRLKGLFGSKRKTSTLQPGAKLSEMGKRACDVDFVAAKTQAAEIQELRFNFAICFMSLWCAESIVRAIEDSDELLSYFNGTARDVLLYEAFIGNYLMLGRLVHLTLKKEWASAFSVYGSGSVEMAAAAASNVISFERHRSHLTDRLMEIGHAESVTEMAEKLADRLLQSKGKLQIRESDHARGEGAEWLQASVGLPMVVLALTNHNMPAAGDVMKNLFTATYIPGAE